MRDSLIEAIKAVEADDAPRFSDLVYVDPAGVVDALVVWLGDLNEGTVLFTDRTGKYAPVTITAGRAGAHWFGRLADLLSEET